MKNAKLKLDLNALYNNAKYVLDQTDGGVIATVKNDAFHFGLQRAIDTFYSAGIRAFATTSLRDAIRIRKMYSDIFILLLNPSTEFELLREYNLSSTMPGLSWIKEHKDDLYGINWHLEWAGCMRRSGCKTEDEYLESLKFAKENNINIEGIWTHFAWADVFNEENIYEREKNRWLKIQKKACELYDFKYVHAQNSASFCRDSKFEGHSHVRVGIILYGCPGYEGWDYKGKIQNAVELSASVVSINKLDPGESIGYCASYVADPNKDCPTSVAVINIGYGDGLLRSRINGHTTEINNKRYNLVSLMMSHTVAVVDENVKIGDTAYFYSDSMPVFEFTYKGVGTNSEQISHLNFETLDLEYIEIKEI